MFRLLFLQFILISLAPALILKRNEGDPDFEDYLMEIFNNFRNQMKDGIPEIKVPPLDPLKLYNININVNEKTAKVKLDFHQIIISKLSKFEIRNLKANLDTLFVNIDLYLPRLDVTGTYNLDGKIINIFPLYGNGKYEINVSEANLIGTGKMVLDKEGLRLTRLVLELTWGQMHVNFENLLNGGSFSKILQKIIPVIGKRLFDKFKPEITNLIEKALINEVNKELKKPEVRKIIEGLLPIDSE